MINEIDLLWVPNYIALGIFFIFGAKFSWNEGIDNCFNIKCVLLGRNFDFLVVTARYQEVTAGYCWLPLVIACPSFQHEPCLSINLINTIQH